MPRGRFSSNPVYVDPVTGKRMKHCERCGQDKCVDENTFPVGPYGFKSICKSCEKDRAKVNREKGGEDLRRSEVNRIRTLRKKKKYLSTLKKKPHLPECKVQHPEL